MGWKRRSRLESSSFGQSWNAKCEYAITTNLMTEEVGIQQLSNNRHKTEGAKLCSVSDETWDRSRWDHTKSSSTFHGIITIDCMAFRKAGANLFDSLPGPEVKPYFVRKMLKEGLDSDATIIASDGERIKCHKHILKGQSDVLEAMFNETSDFLESTTGIIKMEDMSSKSVNAFLAFLYFDDLEGAKADSVVALDLLKAAHKYNVPRLEEQMKRIFLGKPNIWFNLEAAMQLFVFAGKIPDGVTLKKRASVALKSNYSSMWDSPSYKQLFKEDPDVAMELCQYLFSGGPVASSSAGKSEVKDTKSSQSSN